MKDLKCYISENDMLSVRKQCELLDLSRSSIYYQAVGESEENLRIMRLMDEEFLEHPTHEVYSNARFLFVAGFWQTTNRCAGCSENGHYGDMPKRNLSKLRRQICQAYLLRGLKVTRPNQVW
ncbi:hypothetical protein MASR2M47_30400 [Draconibacterium sp.]